MAVFTAIMGSMQLAPVTGSTTVMTMVDYIGFLTMVAGGLVAFEALLSYMWWRRKDCDATRPW